MKSYSVCSSIYNFAVVSFWWCALFYCFILYKQKWCRRAKGDLLLFVCHRSLNYFPFVLNFLSNEGQELWLRIRPRKVSVVSIYQATLQREKYIKSQIHSIWKSDIDKVPENLISNISTGNIYSLPKVVSNLPKGFKKSWAEVLTKHHRLFMLLLSSHAQACPRWREEMLWDEWRHATGLKYNL